MKIFIGAGEDSGDLLGSQLIMELKKRHPLCEVIGVGGPKMLAAGLERSLFPMEDLSLMGFFEILPKLFKILGHLKKIKQFILMEKPDVVITIDAPDFYLRVLRGIKKRSNIPTIHYNAPAVWASRPRRAKKMAIFVDHLLCLFPFEPPYFTRHGMKATFIGHPLTEIDENTDISIFPRDKTLLTVLFGSRTQEVKTLTEPFISALALLQKDIPDLYILVPTFDRFKRSIKQALDQSGLSYQFVNQSSKMSAFKASKAALAASGTISLELAKAHLPFVIGYKLSPLTYYIAKRVITTPYVCLVNVLLNEPFIAECLQDRCAPDILSGELKKLLTASEEAQSFARKKLKHAYANLTPPRDTSSMMACDIVDGYLDLNG